jgi:3-hydroxybutyryl-CoA dehydrogenase
MEKNTPVGIVGAGTMGCGIAQLAAQAGHTTHLFDARPGAAAAAVSQIGKTLQKLVDKGRLAPVDAQTTLARVRPANDLRDLSDCTLVVEAIVEDLGAKKKLFAELEAMVPKNTVLATNTSSLSVTAIAAACRVQERVLGLHFFNPAPMLPLVEVVPGLATAPDLGPRAMERMRSWGKTPVLCKDTPGFIVNRVARPFYGEALRIYEEGVADMPSIDEAMRSVGGFRMGPFELMDLIGNDVNFTVTKTVWESFFYDPRYKPSLTQQRQVESGRLGRKTGRGYYTYEDNVAQVVRVERASSLGHAIVERILAMLVNEAADAVFCGIASVEDIDLAMTKGVNYPKGLLAWADEQGAKHWLAVLEGLQAEYGEDRYRPSPLLRRHAREGIAFHK